MILKNSLQHKILFADTGIERWWAAPVARALVKRIKNQGEQIRIFKSDVAIINRMAEVLHIGKRFSSPFKSIVVDELHLEIDTDEILRIFD